jgi:hypothetical protein
LDYEKQSESESREKKGKRIQGRRRTGLRQSVRNFSSMLPDYPEVRKLISEHQMRQFQAMRSQSMGAFSDIREDPLHEGHRSGIMRDDGSLDELEFKKIEVTRTFKIDEMENWSEEKVRAYYEDIAREVARKQSHIT